MLPTRSVWNAERRPPRMNNKHHVLRRRAQSASGRLALQSLDAIRHALPETLRLPSLQGTHAATDMPPAQLHQGNWMIKSISKRRPEEDSGS